MYRYMYVHVTKYRISRKLRGRTIEVQSKDTLGTVNM